MNFKEDLRKSEIFNEYKEIIFSIYKHYSEIFNSEKNNSEISLMMNLTGFLKFIKDLEKENSFEFSNIRYDNINLIFSKFSVSSPLPYKSKTIKKINFLTFVKILFCMSNTDINSSRKSDENFNFDFKHEQVFENFIILKLKPLFNKLESFLEKEYLSISLFTKTLKDQNVIEFLERMKFVLKNIYEIYSDKNLSMTYEQFTK